MKIWSRYLFKFLAKTFFSILFCLFGLFVLIDYCLNAYHGPSLEIAFYYICFFSLHLPLFLPLAFLLSLLRVLTFLNSHNELIALQMASFSKKRLLLPFFFFASFLSISCYLNDQIFASIAQTNIEFKQGKNKHCLFSALLVDQTELVYQKFDPKTDTLFNVFWLRSPSDVWHMKTFRLDSLEAKSADHMIRNEQNLLEKVESFESKKFSDLPLTKKNLLEKPLSPLHTHYKLLAALFPLLILFAVSPTFLQYRRQPNTFLAGAISLFLFFSLKALLDALLILGENQIFSSSFFLSLPFAFLFSLSFLRFLKI